MKTVKEIMRTQPKSITKNETIRTAVSSMKEANIGFLPVVDENQKVVGTITDRDIALAVARTGNPIQEMKVHEIMTSRVHTVQPEDQTAVALKTMRTKQVGRLPVVDSENRLKGVVSLMGIARKIKNTTAQAELEHQGKENVISTIQSLAERNKKAEEVEEPAEE